MAIVVLAVLGALTYALIGTAIERMRRGATAPAASPVAPVLPGQQRHNAFATADEAARRRAFGELLPREACGRVTATYYQGVRDGVAAWSVRCTSGRAWQVLLREAAEPAVLDCASEVTGSTRCFEGY